MTRLLAAFTLAWAALKLRGRRDADLARLLRSYADQLDPPRTMMQVDIQPGHAVIDRSGNYPPTVTYGVDLPAYQAPEITSENVADYLRARFAPSWADPPPGFTRHPGWYR